MASIKGAIDLTGMPVGHSVYKRADMGGSLIRMPGGATGNKIKNDGNYIP